MRGLLLKLRRLSLRMRLVLAFVALIISSATATIFIGNTVFGNKIREVAASKISLELKFARALFEDELESVLWETKVAALEYLSGKPLEGYSLDAIIKIQDTTSEILYGKPIDTQPLYEFARFVAKKARPTRSPIATPNLLIAAAGVPTKDYVILGIRILNNNAEVLERFLNLTTERKEYYGASLFLGNVRVASTLGNEVLGTTVDPHVANKVLTRGEVYIDYASVVKERFFAAYAPIKDWRGRVIGMLGIGTSLNMYAEIQRRTTTLFTSLILGGMIFGFIMTYLFSAWLIKPISKLAEGMDRVARGDLNYKVRIESADELGMLARSFNTMVRAVKERDMKLREMTEQRLSQVEKQVSIGRLAAGVAHEINNPLTAILTLSSLMLKHLPENDKRREDLKIIIEETTRCRDIVKGLLDFARESPTKKEPIDINQIIKDTLKLTKKYDALENIDLVVELSETPLVVNADRKQLQQVFTNIIINAAEATPEGGTITITTEEDSSGGFAVVKIKDTGKGIPKEHLNRVFEPFFTTKGAGKGTGLGLSVSLGIVQKHGGTIEIESELGKGTEVSIILPLEQ